MRKIIDGTAFYPQEDLSFYFDIKRDRSIEWGEPATKEELIEIFEQWPLGTYIPDVFPHCEPCFKYPIIEDNIYLYRLLTTSKDYKGLFDPLDYFNLLYEQLKYCLDRVNIDTQIILDHLMRLNLTKRKLHFFLFSLHYLIKGLNGSVTADRVWPNGIYTIKNKKLGQFDLSIISEYQPLEKEIGIETENTDLPNARTGSVSIQVDTADPKKNLTHPQIALIHVYERTPITNSNCSKIARKYGFFNPSSGEGLRQDYEYYWSDTNRLAAPNPNTKKRFSNKIKLFESILQYLSDTAIGRAKEEIHSLKTRFENTDW